MPMLMRPRISITIMVSEINQEVYTPRRYKTSAGYITLNKV
jgi:hypothetical protein